MSCEDRDCEKALENLYLFIDSELDRADRAEIQEHIDDCASCLDEYDLERLVKTLVMRSCSEPAPEPLRERVLYSIRTVQVHITEQRGD